MWPFNTSARAAHSSRCTLDPLARCCPSAPFPLYAATCGPPARCSFVVLLPSCASCESVRALFSALTAAARFQDSSTLLLPPYSELRAAGRAVQRRRFFFPPLALRSFVPVLPPRSIQGL